MDLQAVLSARKATRGNLVVTNLGDTRAYCDRPWYEVQVFAEGDVMCCCPPWVDHYALGNLLHEDFDDIWTGERVEAFRESMRDRSFRFCNEKSCPYLASRTVEGPIVTGETPVSIPDLRELTCNYDRSCNLGCPSCRRGIFVASGEMKTQQETIHEKVMSQIVPRTRLLRVTGSGDAFGSPLFRNMLMNLRPEHAPKLKSIVLLTNGLLMTQCWPRLPDFVKSTTKSLLLSIDAATKATYEINRWPGKWEDLLDNLSYIRDLAARRKNLHVNASFVVQANNWREMPAFVDLARRYGVHRISFQMIEPDHVRDWGVDGFYEEWIGKAVHEPEHPDHAEFVELLKDPRLRPTDVVVRLNNFTKLLHGGSLSQAAKVRTEDRPVHFRQVSSE